MLPSQLLPAHYLAEVVGGPYSHSREKEVAEQTHLETRRGESYYLSRGVILPGQLLSAHYLMEVVEVPYSRLRETEAVERAYPQVRSGGSHCLSLVVEAVLPDQLL